MTIINQLTSFKLSGITFSGTSQQLNYTAGVTTGSVIANKALVVDTNKDLIGSDNTTRIRNLTLAGAMVAVSYTGTLLTSNQPNITTLGTLNNLTISNNLLLPGHNGINTGLMLSGNLVLANAHQLNFTVVTPGTGEANKALVLDGSRIINNIHAITTQHIYLTNLYINNIEVTSSATELNYLDIISIGQGEASKALILDSNRNINNINILTANTISATNLNVTNLSGTIQTNNQPNITSVGTLTSLTLAGSITGVTNLSTNQITLNSTLLTSTANEINILSGITVTTAELNYLDINTPGTADASKALVVDSSRNISNINNISLNGSGDVITLTNSGSGNRTTIRFINDVKSWELGSRASANTNPNSFYLWDNSAGVHRLIVNSSGSVNIVNHNGSSTGLQLGGTLVTATATELNRLSGLTATTTELNYLDITTEGQAQASKALILDSSRNINNINILSSVQFNTTNTSVTSVNNSTFTGNYDIYLRRNNTIDGLSHGIAFLTTTNDPLSTLPGASILHTRTALSSGHLLFNTTQVERFRITATGNIGINTTNPDRQLEINSSTGNCLRLTNNDSDGSATNFSDLTVSNTGQLTISPSSNNANTIDGDILLKGTVIIGKDNSNNILRFNGTTNDANSNMTVIGERIYSGTEKSELILFKGNDTGSSSAGPDRIRLRAAEFKFQTYTSVEDYSGLLDNNDRIFIANNGNIAMGGSASSSRLELYNTAGSSFLRLTISGSSNSTDLNTYSDGSLQIKSTSNIVHIGDSTNTSQILLLGSLSNSATSGTLRILQAGAINYIQSAINTTTGSAADLFIGNYNNIISASSRKIMFKSNGRVGFGTINPDLALEINDSLGNCLRLTYNDNDGSATTYCDFTISSNGITTFNTVGSNSAFSFTGGNINGTIGTASQPNITSLGTLTSLNLSGAITGITNLTMSGTLSGVNTINATNISGLLTTVDQTNITGLGILSNLRVNNNIKIGTPSSAAEDLIHIESSSNSFVGIQIENRNTTAETSGCKLSFMGYRDVNNAYEVTRIASVTTTSDAPSFYQYGALAFYTRNNYLDSSLTERMRINNIGLIGINITNPTERLHVNGNILANGTITNTNNIVTSAIVTATNGFTTSSGRVTMSSTDLGLSHRSATGGANRSELVTYSNGTITGIGSYNNFPFALYTNDIERLRVANNGNIGIRTTNPQSLLDFGQNDSDSIINLYTHSTTNNTYKIGANNSLIKYQAGNAGGHAWYNNSNTTSTGTERMRLTSNGFLGIGTSSPTAALTISRTNNNAYIQWTDGTTIAETFINASGIPSIGSNTNHGFGFYTNNDSSFQLYLESSASKNVGIGTSSPSYKLDVTGTINTSGSLRTSIAGQGFSHNDGTINLVSWVNNAIIAGSAFFGTVTDHALVFQTYNTNRMTITKTGNVGIGTSSPQGYLDFGNRASNYIINLYQDGTNVYGFGANDNAVKYLTAGSAGHVWYTGSTLSSPGSEKMRIMASGNVGIGNTNPGYLLTVNGTAKINQLLVGTSTDNASTRLISALDSTMAIGTGRYITLGRSNDLGNQAEIAFTYQGNDSNSNRLGFGFFGGEKMYIYKNGQVFRNDNNSNFNTTSDIRLKENIETANLDLCYNNIKNLRLVYYKWRDQYLTKQEISDRHKLGWIAQEVEKVLPSSVFSYDKYGFTDCKGINVEQIYTTLYGCTKKLIDDKEKLENENIKLNTKIDDMEEVITDLYEQVDNLNNSVNELKELINQFINK